MTGTAIAVAPTPGMVALLEDTAACAALTEAGNVAVGAYDRIPFSSAAAVFTMDTASECFLLHAAQVRCHRCNFLLMVVEVLGWAIQQRPKVMDVAMQGLQPVGDG